MSNLSELGYSDNDPDAIDELVASYRNDEPMVYRGFLCRLEEDDVYVEILKAKVQIRRFVPSSIMDWQGECITYIDHILEKH